MSVKDFGKLVMEAASAWSEDYAPSMGAALAYYTMFSVAPLLLIVISLAGLIFGADAARGEIFEQLRDMMGETSAAAIQGLLQSISKPSEGIIGTVVGVTVLLIGATTVFGELQDALDRIWRAPARTRSSGPWKLLRSRLLSFGMILCIGFLLMVSLLASAALAALTKWFTPLIYGWETIAGVANFALSFALVTSVFAMIYKIMPRVRIQWRDVWVGAGFTALLFTVGKTLIGLYIGRSGIASTFGAAGSLVVVMLWVYYSAQIFLLGAEFTWVYAHRHGSRKGQTRPARGDIPARSEDSFPKPPESVAKAPGGGAATSGPKEAPQG